PAQLLEQARQHSERGEWKDCLKCCQMALFCEPTGDLFAAALYLKALALIELNRNDEALIDLQKVEGLGALYPQFADYANNLKTAVLRQRVV
ncbi:MAG TPA: hypothetical protein VFV50_18140, partial [Bdellovibrionales bacterium]|nr:hypothetical protein [Bdellovibrionales bacterium]